MSAWLYIHDQWHRSTFISTDKYEDEIEENVCMIRVDIRCYSLVINVHDYHLDQIKWHLSTWENIRAEPCFLDVVTNAIAVYFFHLLFI